MAIVSIPLSPVETDYTQRVILDGVEFVFRFFYSEREQRWYFDLATNEETQIVAGLKLVPGIDLLKRVVSDEKPQGTLFLLDLTEADLDPGLAAFEEETHGLFYREATQ